MQRTVIMAKQKINFQWTERFGVTTLVFDGYRYETYDQYTARHILEIAKRRPGRAWNMAKRSMKFVGKENEPEASQAI